MPSAFTVFAAACAGIVRWIEPKDAWAVTSYFLIVPVTIYVGLCTLLCCSARLQRELMYLNRLRLPFSTYWLPFSEFRLVDLNQLSCFRLQHFSRNVVIRTSDGEVLQAWHLAPSHLGPVLARIESSAERERAFDEALADTASPVFLYLHGQAGTRGMLNRVELVRALSAQAQANVLIIDYRGFGGSTGMPSQEGLILDAHAAWDWLSDLNCHGAFIYGQSLGAAVGTQLAASLASQTHGQTKSCKLLGLVLDVPFFSAKDAALKHPLYGFLRWIKPVRDILSRRIVDTWESGAAIEKVKCPVLIFGAGRDIVVGKHAALDLAGVLRANENNVYRDLVIVEQATHSSVHSSDEWLAAIARLIER